MTEYNNVTLVSYNPENPVHRQIYQEIADGLGSELKLKPVTEEGLEEMCRKMFSSEDYFVPENERRLPPRVWIHDNATYREDPLVRALRGQPSDEIPDSYINCGNSPGYPILIYNGSEVGLKDQIRLMNIGFSWVFQKSLEGKPADDNGSFTSSNVVKVVGGIERVYQQREEPTPLRG